MPLFSKIPVLATPNTAGIERLACIDNNCFALFSTLDDSEPHTIAVHAGQAAAATCGIRERQKADPNHATINEDNKCVG
jgi:hypothetical protein